MSAKGKKTAEVVFSSHFQNNGKKTSIGGRKFMIKTSSMNKHRRRGYKPYRGQGR